MKKVTIEFCRGDKFEVPEAEEVKFHNKMPLIIIAMPGGRIEHYIPIPSVNVVTVEGMGGENERRTVIGSQGVTPINN